MDLTQILAGFWGIVLVVCGIALIVNKKLLAEILRDKERDEFLLISGFIALLIGALHVSIYNYWELNERGLITLFGWAALLKGAIRLSFPQLSKEMIGKVGGNKTLYYPLLVVLLAAGVYLLFISL